MKPYDENIQTFAAMFDGYDQALTRLEAAAKGREPAPAFIALFEALNWAVALDDRAGKHFAPQGKTLGFGWRDWPRGAHLMRAVRFARNNVHHQWSDALALDKRGLTPPITPPVVWFEWCWRHSYAQRAAIVKRTVWPQKFRRLLCSDRGQVNNRVAGQVLKPPARPCSTEDHAFDATGPP
jgi:hypothetical protein